MNKKKRIVLVNLWGLGDMFPTFYFIKKNKDKKYYFITTHDKNVVENLIKLIDLNSDITVSPFKNKFLVIFDIFKNILNNNLIIFTAPLSGKARKFAIIISFFYKKTILVNEKGNMYYLNEKIKIY